MTYYQQNVLAAIKTDTDNLTLAGTSNVNVATSTVTITASSTRPTASGRSNSHWIQSEGLCYMKMSPFFASAATSPALRVIGWNLNEASGLWIPVTLCDLSVTTNSTDTTINTGSLRQARLITKNQGDAKLFNSDATLISGAAFLVDTLGSQIIEIAYRAASGTAAANTFYSSI